MIVSNSGLSSTAVSVQLQPAFPGFFVIPNSKYVVATHADGTLIGPTNLLPGLTTPAQPGETIVLYGTGFGPTNPAADGQVLTGPVPAVTLPVVSIGGAGAPVTFAGLISAGLFQVNVQLSSTVADGDAAITAVAGTAKSQTNVFIAVQKR